MFAGQGDTGAEQLVAHEIVAHHRHRAPYECGAVDRRPPSQHRPLAFEDLRHGSAEGHAFGVPTPRTDEAAGPECTECGSDGGWMSHRAGIEHRGDTVALGIENGE